MSPMVMMALKVVEPMLRSVLSPDGADKLMRELKVKALEVDETEIKAKQSVLLAEINSGNKLTSSWRPHMMYLMGAVIAFDQIIAPIFDAMFFPALAFLINLLPLDQPVQPMAFGDTSVPEEVWNILLIAIPGYIGVRGVEKVTASITGKSASNPPTLVSNVVKRLTGQSKPKPTPPPVRTFREQPVDKAPPDLDYDLAELPVEKKD